MTKLKKLHFRNSAVALVSLALFVLSIVFVWGVSSSWGTVKTGRVTFTYSCEEGDSDNYTGSYLLYRPLSVSEAKPGKLIVLIHGGTSTAFAVKNYAIEYARRGYVVMCPDLPGSGYSDNVGESSSKTLGKTYNKYTEALYRQIAAMNYIDQNDISMLSFSNGSGTAQSMISQHPEVYSVIGNTSNANDGGIKFAAGAGINYWGIDCSGAKIPAKSSLARSALYSRGEEYANGGLRVTGDIAAGTGVAIRYNSGAYVHVLMPDSTEMMVYCMELQEMCMPTATSLAADDLVFWQGELFSVIALICMIVFAVSAGAAMLETEFFASLRHPARPVAILPKPDKKSRLIKIGVTVAEFAVFTVLYRLMGGKVTIPNTAFTPIWINNLMPYLLLLAVYQIGKFIFFNRRHRDDYRLSDAGVTWQEGAKTTAANIGKAALIGLIIGLVIFVILDFVNSNLGVNVQFLCFVLCSLPLKKAAATPAYIIMYVVIFFGTHVAAYGLDRNSGREDSFLKTLGKAYGGALITVGPVLVWMVRNWMGWKEFILLQGIDGVSDRLYGYVLMVAIITPLHAFLYKKTKSIWPGVFICAFIMTFMVCANFPLTFTYFG